MGSTDSTQSPAPAQEPPAPTSPTAYQLERRARREQRRAAKARRIARNLEAARARLQSHLTTDSATFAALNGVDLS